MRKQGAITAVFLLAILLLATSALAQSQQTSPIPPKNLKLVGDHWTPWDPPPAGPDHYIIQKGDTLWDLAEEWLGDPYLWPQVWDENRYILDSHWIYPGDPLVVPGRPTVVPPEGPPTEVTDTGVGQIEEPPPAEFVEIDHGYGRGGPEDAPEPPPAPSPAPLLPVADPGDVYCSGYVDPEHQPSDLQIVGHELEREYLGQGNVIYMNMGRSQGIQPGSEYAIRRAVKRVRHPATREDLGSYVRRMGKLRVIAVQENTATALITLACEDIVVGDGLVPWEEIPVPMMRSIPEFRRYEAEPSGGTQGYIVVLRDQLNVAGTGAIIHTDIGGQTDVEPGNVITLYRDNGDHPRLMLGQAVVLTVEPTTSTAKITTAVREMWIGDRAEISP
jgi:hypothetical protein